MAKKFYSFSLIFSFIIYFQFIISEIKIDKIVIPVTDLENRFSPLAKSISKEIIPLLDKPAIEYAIEESYLSGIKNICIITNKDKSTISDYLVSSLCLTKFLKENNEDNFLNRKDDFLNRLNRILESLSFEYISQEKPLGLAHAVLMAKNYVDNNFFAVILPDDIIISAVPAIKQLIDIAKEKNATVLAVQEVAKKEISSHGVIEIKNKLSDNLFEVQNIVEKPSFNKASSNFLIVGRYILSPKIFKSIEEISKNAKKEIQLIDAIVHMLKNGEPVFAYKIDGDRYDIGSLDNWITTMIKDTIK